MFYALIATYFIYHLILKNTSLRWWKKSGGN